VDHAERSLGGCCFPTLEFGGIEVRLLKLAVFLEDALDTAVNGDSEEQASQLV